MNVENNTQGITVTEDRPLTEAEIKEFIALKDGKDKDGNEVTTTFPQTPDVSGDKAVN